MGDLFVRNRYVNCNASIRTAATAELLVEDLKSCVDAGVFAVLAEHIPSDLLQRLSESCELPVLSLGSGHTGDGTCIVSGDAVGYAVMPPPSHAKGYCDVRPAIIEALGVYRDLARQSRYPTEDKSPHLDDQILVEIRQELGLQGG
jgi:3-methyl-2-oxobutanoate hydroxymethyltransferase